MFDFYRAYAIQRRHPISFRLIPAFDRPLSDDVIHNSTHGLLSDMVVYNDKDAAALMGLSLLMEIFSVIDDNDVNCWNGVCGARNGCCTKQDDAKILSLHDSVSRVDYRNRYGDYDRVILDDLSETRQAGSLSTTFMNQYLITQYADILVTQKWLQNRIWQFCLAHNLLKVQPHRPELGYTFAVTLAESTLDICQSLSLSSMEAHGLGLVRDPSLTIYGSIHTLRF